MFLNGALRDLSFIARRLSDAIARGGHRLLEMLSSTFQALQRAAQAGQRLLHLGDMLGILWTCDVTPTKNPKDHTFGTLFPKPFKGTHLYWPTVYDMLQVTQTYIKTSTNPSVFRPDELVLEVRCNVLPGSGRAAPSCAPTFETYHRPWRTLPTEGPKHHKKRRGVLKTWQKSGILGLCTLETWQKPLCSIFYCTSLLL